MQKQEIIALLRETIERAHACKAAYRRTVPVREKLADGVEWKGQIEVFWLTGHPRAKRCYAWLEEASGPGDHPRINAVLEIPPVIGPATALRLALAKPVLSKPWKEERSRA